MGRAPCCSKVGLNRGPWTANEDALLIKYIKAHGEGQWRSMPKKAGLLRCGKSCRLRWKNYLRPDIKRGNITQEEDDLIIRLHGLLGNKWSLIAGRLPGRTDNEIKNYWNTHLSKRLRSQGTDPNTHKKLSESELEKLAKRRKKKKCRSLMINNNNRTNKKMKFEELNEVTIRDDNGMSMDNNNNVRSESIGDRTNVHLSKPNTVNSVISVTRGNSNASLETITSGSSSHHGLITSYDSENNIIFDMSWVSNNAYMEHNGLDDHLIMTMGSPYGNNGVVAEPDNNQQFEKLYEEYLQLIKVDHHDSCYYNNNEDNDVDGVGETQLDSFTKSFLI